MHRNHVSQKVILAVALPLLGLGALAAWRVLHADPAAAPDESRPAPVAVAAVEHGPIELRRTFTGTLEAFSSFVVAPKVAGRIETIAVDIGDSVRRGQVVAELDDAEFVQEVAQAEAELRVAEATVAGARSLAEAAEREVQRLAGLAESGFTSQSQFDAAKAQHLAREAELKVAEAGVIRAKAQLESARIRLGYTRVAADWTGDDMERVVAERFVDEGDTVSATTPLLRIVEIDRLINAFFVTEKDYARLHVDQPATFVTDAYPGVTFRGSISRIAPVFRETTRQARVELLVHNTDRRLRPGMFVRATLLLDRVENAVIVPQAALTRRNNEVGVFLVDASGTSVRWVPVQTGIREGDRVEIVSPRLQGRVVVLGQQLIEDGAAITIADDFQT